MVQEHDAQLALHAQAQAEALGMAWAPEIEPDGVAIATPNQLHVPNGVEAVQAGVPMLLERAAASGSVVRLTA